MASIPASQIVSVTPSVVSAGGNALVLNGLIMSSGTRAPIGAVLSFATTAAVTTYFGAGSTEATLAGYYFGGFTNSNQKPGSLLFAQYPTVAVAAYLRGGSIASITLATLQAMTGTLIVTADGALRTTTSFSLSSATSYSSAAALISTALAATTGPTASITGSIAATVLTVSAVGSGTVQLGSVVSGAGVTAGTIITGYLTGTGATGTYTVSQSQTVASEALTTAFAAPTCTFDSVSGALVITSGTTGPTSSMSVATGTLATSLNLTTTTGAVLSQGAAIATPSAAMSAVLAVTANWATFMTTFEPVVATKLLFAAWVNGQNNQYAYVCYDSDPTPTLSTSASASFGYLNGLNGANNSGVIPVYLDPNVAAFVMGSIASINFNQLNGRATLAFKGQTGISATVTNVTVSTNLLANGYNFLGGYATANQPFIFFFNGQISGPFAWIDSYVDQIAMNAQFQLALLTLLNTVFSIPYNSAGYTQVKEVVAGVADTFVNFGAIRTGVVLSATEIVAVINQAGFDITQALFASGYYIMITDPGAQARVARSTPNCTFFYTDGGSIQQLNLASIELQ